MPAICIYSRIAMNTENNLKMIYLELFLLKGSKEIRNYRFDFYAIGGICRSVDLHHDTSRHDQET